MHDFVVSGPIAAVDITARASAGEYRASAYGLELRAGCEVFVRIWARRAPGRAGAELVSDTALARAAARTRDDARLRKSIAVVTRP